MKRSKILYLFLLIAVVILNIVNTSYVPYLVNRLMIAIPVAMLIIAIILRTGTRVSISLESDVAYVNEEFNILLEVENRSYIPITLLSVWLTHTSTKDISKKKKERVYITVPARTKRIVEKKLIFKHCMSADIYLNRYVVYDYLSFWGFKKKIKTHVPVSIIPQIREYNGCTDMIRENEDLSSDRYSQVKPGGDPAEVFGIKEYVLGDKIRNIHWKLSSKMDKLMVKQLSLPINDTLSLIIDIDTFTDKNKMNVADECLESFFAFAFKLIEANYAFKVFSYNGEFISEFIDNPDALIMVMGRIVKYSKTETGISAIDYFMEENNKDRRFITYFTPELTNDKANKLEVLSEYNDVWVYTSGNWDGFYFRDIQMLQTGTGEV